MATVHAESLFTTASPGGPQLTRDAVRRVQPGTTPNYNRGTHCSGSCTLVERTQLAAEREHYLQRSPAVSVSTSTRSSCTDRREPTADILDPARQDNKTDFQKQNVASFTHGGYDARARVGHHGELDRAVSAPLVSRRSRFAPCPRRPATPSATASRLWLQGRRDAGAATARPCRTTRVRSLRDRAVGLSAGDPARATGSARRGRDRPRGAAWRVRTWSAASLGDFERGRIEDQFMVDVAPDIPCTRSCRCTSRSRGPNAQADGVGHPARRKLPVRVQHGAPRLGPLPQRRHQPEPARRHRLPRISEPALELRPLRGHWRARARRCSPGTSTPSAARAPCRGGRSFMAVDYMDLHILKPELRHRPAPARDNQEAFLMMEGRGYMVVGDWCQHAAARALLRGAHPARGPFRHAQGRQPPRPDECDRRGHLAVHVRRLRLTAICDS